MQKNRNIQLKLVFVLLIGFVFTTTSAFSYWREVTVSNDVEIISIGEPVEIIVTDLNSSPETMRLVPSGYVMQIDDVEYVTLTYQVGVSKELLNTVDLVITTQNVLINDDSTYAHLIDIDIMDMGDVAVLDIFNDSITITVVIRLIEPIDAQEANELGLDPSLVNVEDSIEAYNAIQGQRVSFQLLFELQNKE